MKLIQSIYKEHVESTQHLNEHIKNTFRMISMCQSGKLGYHKIVCEECGENTFQANSCRNRHCPICQKQKKEDWIIHKEQNIIHSSYYHIVATVPSILYHIMRQNQEQMYQIIMNTSAEAVMEVLEDKKYMGAKVGILQILHTWNQKLDHHPHTHMLVTKGGIDENGLWKEKEGEYLVPVKVLSKVFRRKFVKELQKQRGKLTLIGEIEKYKEEKEWNKLIKTVNRKEFVTYIKEPYANPATVIEYFGRYAYNVGISNSRIKEYKEEKIVIEYRDRKDENKKKEMRMLPEVFIQKMSFHILPKGFRKIRSYGILSNRGLKERVKEINKQIKNNKKRKEQQEFRKRICYIKCPKCGSEKCYIEYSKISVRERLANIIRKRE